MRKISIAKFTWKRANRVVAVSGNANNGGNTGAFCVNANNSVTNTNANYGRQLSLLMKLKNCLHASLPLGKKQSKSTGAGSHGESSGRK